MRSGGSVLEAPPGAEEGALPREYRPRAAYTNCLYTQKRLSGISESLFCIQICKEQRYLLVTDNL